MHPDIELNPHEARLLGVLIEKALTTPDQYPLSIAAATAGCNQKSNRDPVVDWTEAEIDVGLQGLVAKGLAGRVRPAGSRVEKFRHNAEVRLGVEADATAVLAELLMRGPQAPGELRARAGRMRPLPAQSDLQRVLGELADGGLARRIAPAHGSRAERWTQMLVPDPRSDDAAPAPTAGVAPAPLAARASSAPVPVPGSGRADPQRDELARLRRQVDFLAESLGVELPE